MHLVADLYDVVAWAEAEGRWWAISDRNAGAGHAQFSSHLDDLAMIDWRAGGATDWRAPDVKEGKQAELLVYGSFPWTLVERVGVLSVPVQRRAEEAMVSANHRPRIGIERLWYY